MTSLPPNDSKNTNNNSSSSVIASVLAGNKDSVNEIGALQTTLREAIKSPHDLDEAVNYLYQSLLEDAVVNVFLEVHYLNKTDNLVTLDGIAAAEGSETSMRIADMPNYDIFGLSTAQKRMNVSCPNCDKLVSSSHFTHHLWRCVIVLSRRPFGCRKEDLTAGSNIGTDNDDDVDGTSEKRRRKIAPKSTNNGSKKNNNKKKKY